MTKQKIVIRIPMDDQKSRSKALKVSVSITGVESATVKGDQVEVIGDGVDAVELTRRLRKSMSHAELVGVDQVKEAPATAAAKAVAPQPQTQVVWMQPYNNGYPYLYPNSNYTYPPQVTDPSCTIM